jgi:hypothetical protein
MLTDAKLKSIRPEECAYKLVTTVDCMCWFLLTGSGSASITVLMAAARRR